MYGRDTKVVLLLPYVNSSRHLTNLFDVNTWGSICDERTWKQFIRDHSTHLHDSAARMLEEVASQVDNLELYFRKNESRRNAEKMGLYGGTPMPFGSINSLVLARLLVIDQLDRLAWALDVGRTDNPYVLYCGPGFFANRNSSSACAGEHGNYLGYDSERLHKILKDYSNTPLSMDFVSLQPDPSRFPSDTEKSKVEYTLTLLGAAQTDNSLSHFHQVASNLWRLTAACFSLLGVVSFPPS
jgi:hypothetical protein